MRRGTAWVVVALLMATVGCGQKPGAASDVAVNGPVPAAAPATTELMATATPAAPQYVADGAAVAAAEPPAATEPPPPPTDLASPSPEPRPTASDPAPTPEPTEARSADARKENRSAQPRRTASLPAMCRPVDWPGRADEPSEDVITDIVAYGREHPRDWAEFWLWGDEVRIAVTGDIEGHQRRLDTVIRDRHPFTVMEVRWSWRQLRRVHRHIADTLRERGDVAGAEPQGSGINAMHNIVEVMLDKVDRDVRREMARMFGTDMYCVEEGSIGPS